MDSPLPPLSLDLSLMSAPGRPHPWTPLARGPRAIPPSFVLCPALAPSGNLAGLCISLFVSPALFLEHKLRKAEFAWVSGLLAAGLTPSPQQAHDVTECRPAGTPQSGEGGARSSSLPPVPGSVTPVAGGGQALVASASWLPFSCVPLVTPRPAFSTHEARDIRNAQKDITQQCASQALLSSEQPLSPPQVPPRRQHGSREADTNVCMGVCQCPWSTMARYCTLGGLTQPKCVLPSSGGQKSAIQIWSGRLPPEALEEGPSCLSQLLGAQGLLG